VTSAARLRNNDVRHRCARRSEERSVRRGRTFVARVTHVWVIAVRTYAAAVSLAERGGRTLDEKLSSRGDLALEDVS